VTESESKMIEISKLPLDVNKNINNITTQVALDEEIAWKLNINEEVSPLWKDRIQMEKDEALAKILQKSEEDKRNEMIKSQREHIKELRKLEDIIHLNGLKDDVELEPLDLESNTSNFKNDKLNNIILISDSIEITEKDDELLALALQEAENEEEIRKLKKEKKKSDKLKEKEDLCEVDKRIAQLIQDEEYAKALEQEDNHDINVNLHSKKRSTVTSSTESKKSKLPEIKQHTPREKHIRKPTGTLNSKDREIKLRRARERVLSEEHLELQSDILEWKTDFLEKFKRAAKKEDYTPEIKQKLDELKKVRAELKEIYSKQSKILTNVK